MLLLGAGESGKSTILKQMRMIHTEGFTEEERKEYKMIVYSNIILAMRTILEAMETLEISLGNLRANDAHKELILNQDTIVKEEQLDPGVILALKSGARWQVNPPRS